ncbi:MAG: redoxin domain-containing protein [Niabella sp.]
MKTTTLLSVMAGLCLHVSAQQPIKPLYINERLPNITLNHIVNYKAVTARLSDMQCDHTKMVLFDFWLTSCIPCVRRLPHLDSLQQQFDGRLQIIMVTREETEVVSAFLKKWEATHTKKFTIPVVTKDTLIEQYFRQQTKPSYAWLATDNVCMAQTASTFITAEMIENCLNVMADEVNHRGYLKNSNLQNNIKR